jgi:hypothetical protein
LELGSDFFCHFVEGFAADDGEVAKVWQFVAFEARDYVDVQVKYVLTGGFAVLLNDAYAIGLGYGFDGCG